MKVDLLILHYNRPDLTDACVTHCLKIADEWNQIWIVDNGSDLPYACDHERVTVLRSEQNAGFSGGVNFGWKAIAPTEADAVFLLNNDAHLAPGALTILKEFAAARSEVWTCCGMGFAPEDPNGLPQEIPAPLSRTIPYIPQPWQQVMSEPPTEPHQTEWITGAAMLIKRQAMEAVGPWREAYFLYWEDVDFGWRVNAAGGQNWFVPHAHFYHKMNSSSSDRKPQVLYYYHRNHLMFWRRHRPLRLLPILWQHLRWSIQQRDGYWMHVAREKAVIDWFLRRRGPIPESRIPRLQDLHRRQG